MKPTEDQLGRWGESIEFALEMFKKAGIPVMYYDKEELDNIKTIKEPKRACKRTMGV